MTTVKYENKTVQVTENLPGKDFKRDLLCKTLIKMKIVKKTSFL
jgi:hypothetical protein